MSDGLSQRAEAKRRAYYDAHRHDPDLWSEPLAPDADAEHPRGVGSTITVRFAPEEAARIRAFAKLSGKSYSDIIRAAVDIYTHPTFTLERSALNSFNSLFASPSPSVGAAELKAVGAEVKRHSATGHWPQ
ncbi:MAG: hypothetical protein ACYDCQ_08015 [Dehalococcoidia bacterium]